jgi:hypothetical protein
MAVERCEPRERPAAFQAEYQAQHRARRERRRRYVIVTCTTLFALAVRLLMF